MIERALPERVAVVEAFGDLPGTELYPEEEAALGDAVDKRRREFATGRTCARRALARLDVPSGPIATGSRGEPLWPDHVIGSITHCTGYRACAVARTSDLVALGIDAEPNVALPDGLLPDIASAEEIDHLRALGRVIPDMSWDRLLFSAKEAVYKAWYPLAERWLGFEDAVVDFDPATQTFSARLLVAGPVVKGVALTGFGGRWVKSEQLVLAAVAATVPAAAPNIS